MFRYTFKNEKTKKYTSIVKPNYLIKKLAEYEDLAERFEKERNENIFCFINNILDNRKD